MQSLSLKLTATVREVHAAFTQPGSGTVVLRLADIGAVLSGVIAKVAPETSSALPNILDVTLARIGDQSAARSTIEVAQRVGLTLLAGIGMDETGHGRNKNTSSVGARGPLQFMPSTWAQMGVDGDGDGVKDILDIDDAAHGAANYLVRSGVKQGPDGVTRISTCGCRPASMTSSRATCPIP